MKATVLGAAGYVGGELLRLALGHPELDVVQATSRRHAGRPVGLVHPHLRHHAGLLFTEPDALEPVDVLFSALPRGELARVHDRITCTARTVVDLGPDFRDPDGPGGAGYVTGLPELYRGALVDATRISVPGCMATAAAVAIRPLVAAGLTQDDAVVDARAGSSGAGAEPSRATHHPERQHAMRIYKATGHRHEREIARLCGVRARMTVTAVPLVRGVQVVAHLRPPRPVSRTEVWSAFRDAYADEPFVRLVAHRSGLHRLPDPQFLSGSNFVDLGFDVDDDGRRVVVVAALDNLVKGAAGGAVQSLNVAQGLEERTGLDFPGLHPV
ncbi:N-acetyl-gamma-glutamyl-phosphate reductase [Streptomyces sp. AF1A]|uniref:N-acetyl-gamma-glutamyl-phosphate reductase n=1 Tax=Streptomyces sp. AF1A TaxID=3394350 RepID=UPI0039BD26B3